MNKDYVARSLAKLFVFGLMVMFFLLIGVDAYMFFMGYGAKYAFGVFGLSALITICAAIFHRLNGGRNG